MKLNALELEGKFLLGAAIKSTHFVSETQMSNEDS